MSYILLGIKDYCKDVWHDWLLDRLRATYPNDADFDVRHWKEGNLRHYIHQRRIAKKRM